MSSFRIGMSFRNRGRLQNEILPSFISEMVTPTFDALFEYDGSKQSGKNCNVCTFFTS